MNKFSLKQLLLSSIIISSFMLSGCLNTSSFRDESATSMTASNSASTSGTKPTAPTHSPKTSPSGAQQAAMPGKAEGICLVLALPNSGKLAPTAQKIRHGAQVAQKKLVAQDRKILLRYIDTSQENWLSALQALPPHCAMVGGPLEEINFTRAQSAKVTEQRNFFVFLPTLPSILGKPEGVVGWRLFPSKSDETRTMLALGQALGIQQYGALYAGQSADKRLYTAFRQQKPSAPTVAYTESTVDGWNAASKKLIHTQKTKTSMPLEAIFLPVTWSHLDGISSALHRNGAQGVMLLGHSQWAQSRSVSLPDSQKYTLAVFPESINPDNLPSGIDNFWSALGHDFIQLGTKLALNTYTSAALLNEKLHTMPVADFAMAPIRWNSSGIARQDMYIFRVTDDGAELTSAAEMQGFRQKELTMLGRATATPAKTVTPRPQKPVQSRDLTLLTAAPAQENSALPKLNTDKKQTFTNY